jgi:hypothetical protein
MALLLLSLLSQSLDAWVSAEVRKLEGTWVVESSTVNGRPEDLPRVGMLGLSLDAVRSQESPGTGKKAEPDAAKKFIGTWEGTMTSPLPGFEKFPVKIVIAEFTSGKWCGDLHHDAPLDADGKLLGIKVEGKTMHLAQSISRGRERCLDGLNILTLIDDNTMEREWVDPETGKTRDKGTLKRKTK